MPSVQGGKQADQALMLASLVQQHPAEIITG